MTKTALYLLAATALAACGSNSSVAPTAPKEPQHDRDHEGVASGGAVTTPDSTAASKEPPSPAEPPKLDPATVMKARLRVAEAVAFEAARPVFARACARCHTKAGKKATKKRLDNFDLDLYSLGEQHTATIGFTIRDVLGISGKKPTMPYDKPGSVQGDDLAAIKAWSDAWEASYKVGAHLFVDQEDHDD